MWLFVVNPTAGEIDETEIKRKIKDWAQDHEFTVECYTTNGATDKKELERLKRQKSIEAVVSVGGDGTLLLCTEIFMDNHIPIGIIPGGSSNSVAKELNIPTQINKALSVLSRRSIRQIDLIEINSSQLCLHMADVGVHAQMIKDYEEENFSGFSGYFKSAVRTLDEIPIFSYDLQYADHKERGEAHYLVLSNGQYFGTGVPINQLGKIDDGWFEICSLKDINKFDLIDWFSDNAKHTMYRVRQAQKCTIRFSEEVDLQIDGEYQGLVNELSVKCLPEALLVFVPSET